MNDQELSSLCNEYLKYNSETGVFIWKKKNSGITLGSIAGGLNKKGYWTIYLSGKHYRAHRLAFLIHYKYLPPYPQFEIEHKNRVRSDNRILNLRKATHEENLRNCGIRKNNQSGFKGVHWHKHSKKWTSSITISRKRKYLGYFTCPIEAAKAYNKAALELHGEFAFLNPIP